MYTSYMLWSVKARFRSHGSSCEVCGRQNATGGGFPPSSLVFPCQYFSTSAPHSFSFQ
jgi:hypothetical protein